MKIESYQKRTWVEIDLDAIRFNFQQVKNNVAHSKICCVIKANAYGHGAVQLAKVYEELGADYFAVSNIEEALQLRQHNITQPILVLGYTDPQCASLLALNNISQCVFSKEYGYELSKKASALGTRVNIHIKLDTGMGRIGFSCKHEKALDVESISEVCKYPYLVPEGIFTHFASADEGRFGEAYTRRQFSCFNTTIKMLSKQGINFSVCHCANSATIFDYPEMRLNMVRAGVVLYGLQPSNELRNKVELRQAMTLHTIIAHIKLVEIEDSISYGRTYVANSKRRIATIPIGYADGLWRSNTANDVMVQIKGQYAPIVGRICMDQCMIDVTDLQNISLGDEVVVYGLSDVNSIDKIARSNNTINYEIVCAIGERVPRVYKSGNEIVGIVDNIVRN